MIKQIIQGLIITFVALFVFLPVQEVAYAAEESDAAVITMSATTSDKEVAVTVDLRQNTALSGLTVEVSYDASAMTLTGVERGKALSSLDYITSNPNTDKGYAITPFKIMWSGDENDFSTGTLVKLRFAIKENAQDGEYVISLRTSGSNNATYLEGKEVKTKNVLIDGTKIRIENDTVTAVITDETENEDEKKPNVALIVSLSVAGAAVLAGTVVLVLKLKGKKTWKKVK